MTTRSAVLAAGNLAGKVGGVVFVCPANTTTLVKSFYIYSSASQSDLINCTVRRVNPAAAALVFNQPPSANGVLAIQTWFVMEPSDELQLVQPTGLLQYWISGALLPLRTA